LKLTKHKSENQFLDLAQILLATETMSKSENSRVQEKLRMKLEGLKIEEPIQIGDGFNIFTLNYLKTLIAMITIMTFV